MTSTDHGNDDHEGGLAKAADSFAENLGDQVPDNVDDAATDDADGRTRTHSSISEGMNANDDEPPTALRDGDDKGSHASP